MALLVDFPNQLTDLFVPHWSEINWLCLDRLFCTDPGWDCIWCHRARNAEDEYDRYSTCTEHSPECVEQYEGSDYDYHTICKTCNAFTEIPCYKCGNDDNNSVYYECTYCGEDLDMYEQNDDCCDDCRRKKKL